ncbi:MAG: hypothetical protein IKB02_02940 [Clostridia bacterium]|nr:hypothetical protein [Clostridia bacterium]
MSNTNESYNRCLSQLKARYGSRGISVNMERSVNAQKKAEEEAVSSSYYLFDSRSGIASSFKSGEYKGSKYMTSEDFLRYFRSRRPYSVPVKNNRVAEVSAHKGTREGSSDSKEGHLSRAISTLKRLREKWLPTERREGRTEIRGFKFPIAAVSYILVFSFSLGLLVSGSVMIGNASGELGELNTKISVLEARESELQSEIDLKYDIASIKADAEELGMISSQFVGGKTLEAEADEEVEVYGEAEEVGGFAALLSAIGIDVD